MHLMIKSYFSLEELETLCFSIDIPWGDVGQNETHDTAITNILLYTLRHPETAPLLCNRLKELRPAVDWPKLF